MDLDGLQRLHEVVARATEATSVDSVARVLVDEGVAVLGATMGGFWRVVGEELELVHFTGLAPSPRFQRIAIASDAPLAVCVREREPIWLEDARSYERRFPDSLDRLKIRVGCACLPLVVDGRAIGGAVFAFEGARQFTEPEQASLRLLARQCAHALDRIHLIEAERDARRAAEALARRMDALQRAAARLAAARGGGEIVPIVIRDGRDALAGSGAALWLMRGDVAVLAAHDGLAASIVGGMTRVGIDDPGPLGGTLRSREPLWLDSLAAVAAQYSLIEDRWTGVGAIAIVPLVADGRLLGAYGIAFDRPRTFDVGEREFLELYAAHAAQAFARDREDAVQRALATAGAELASSLDIDAVLARVGQLVVETFADWCFVDLVRGEGWVDRVVVAHADPEARELAMRLRQFRAPQIAEPALFDQLDDEGLRLLASDPVHADALRALRVQAILRVPMQVAGRTIGMITWATGTRALEQADARIAEQLARSAAAAVENARLYQALAASARRVGKLYELAVALSSARTPEDVASVTARLATEASGAESCMIWTLGRDGALRVRGSSAPPDWTAQWFVLSKDPELPANRVVATGEPLWVETPRDYASQAAAVFERVQVAGRVKPFVALPLVIGGERTGVISFGWRGEHRFEPDERTFLQAVARTCEQAIERAQLYSTEAGARTAAESASRAKDEFLAMLGHELRNPLAPIVTALELMRMRDVADGLRERAVIERQVAHLTRLVDDLLDISRITRGQIELRRTIDELRRAVEPAIDAVGPLLLQQRHQISVDVPASGLPIDGDPARLSQIVRNLLANAAKFTPAGGQIWLAARAAGPWIELTVRDNGPGIAPDLLPRIFEAFVQGSQGAERSFGGLGLGLAIVKNLVELHGGTVVVGSEGSGTLVTVRLPRAVHPQRARDAVEPAATSGRSVRVLVVDDNVDAAALLGDLLRCLGHQPLIAHDGAAALAVVEEQRPQLAILDIGLPGMDGYELARRLRERPDLAGVPVVALTGYGQASDRERTRAAGFAEHLVKPIDLRRLDEVVARFVP